MMYIAVWQGQPLSRYHDWRRLITKQGKIYHDNVQGIIYLWKLQQTIAKSGKMSMNRRYFNDDLFDAASLSTKNV